MTATTVEAPLDLRPAWQRWRAPAVVVTVVLLVALILAVVENAPPSRPLDPRDTSAGGGRALAELLRDRDVDIVQARTVTGNPLPAGATVFVPDPASLTRS